MIRPIKNDADYANAISRITELIGCNRLDNNDSDELEILKVLCSHYAQEQRYLDTLDPVEAIKQRMIERGLSKADLVQFLGQQSRVSEVLNKKRKINLTMIRKLHDGLDIAYECLVRDYEISSNQE
ncbi:helix-turn-helix domain-containing protein [Photobacterium leiognathi]|uniref:helix-turn-helix domain-containing protein n=1 Tax=Photobacterium leiognathi TaxID=553611 RepID=UPI002738F14D|nr:DNA-binding protein [Photobacterium leiognathi]